jgi:hypothetical protein
LGARLGRRPGQLEDRPKRSVRQIHGRAADSTGACPDLLWQVLKGYPARVWHRRHRKINRPFSRKQYVFGAHLGRDIESPQLL